MPEWLITLGFVVGVIWFVNTVFFAALWTYYYFEKRKTK